MLTVSGNHGLTYIYIYMGLLERIRLLQLPGPCSTSKLAGASGCVLLTVRIGVGGDLVR